MQTRTLRGLIVLVTVLLPSIFACCNNSGDPLSPSPPNPHPGLDPSAGGGLTPTERMPHNLPLPHNEMTTNSIVYSNIMLNVSGALNWLIHNRLNDVSNMPDGTFGAAGVDCSVSDDPGCHARTLMQYIVSCALDEGAEVSYRFPDAGLPDPDAGTSDDLLWHGELGLCGVNSPAGEWENATPTNQCLQLVSACLLARVNAYGLRVPLSIRGEPSGLFPSRDRVPVEEYWRSKDQIESFADCAVGQGGVGKNCGWDAAYVGRCTAKSNVTVKLLGVDPIKPGTAAMRVCYGIYGCNTSDITPPNQRYVCNKGAGFICETAPGKCGEGIGNSADSVTFECPDNGPPGYGYYSIMVPKNLPDGVRVNEVPQGSDSYNVAHHYPATEYEVFTYREGSFFGNIFQPDAQEGPEKVDGFPYRDAFACFSDIWSNGFDYILDRVCAGKAIVNGTVVCGDAHPRPCEANPAPVDNSDGTFFSDNAYACKEGYSDNEGAYKRCKGAEDDLNYWDLPITVFLNGPCDLLEDEPSKVCSAPPSQCELAE